MSEREREREREREKLLELLWIGLFEICFPNLFEELNAKGKTFSILG